MTNQAGEKGENSFRKVMNFFSKPRKQVSDSSSTSLGLRRSRSLTSAGFLVDGLEQGNLSPPSNHNRSALSSKSNALNQKCNRLSRSRTSTPERQSKAHQNDTSASLNVRGLERPSSSRVHHDSSGSSSNCSSNNTIDRYVDVEQQPLQGRSKVNNGFYQRNCVGNGSCGGGRRPPRVQYPAPTSPVDSFKDKPRSHSFREAKGTRHHFSSRDWVENGFGHESPRRLAKNVIERL